MRRRGRTTLLANRRQRTLRYRAPAWTAAAVGALVAAIAVAMAFTGYVLAGSALIGAVVLAWLALTLRVARLEPAGPRGNGPTPPGGAGMREPRRPLPYAPAGAAAMPLPDEEEPPRRAVAFT